MSNVKSIISALVAFAVISGVTLSNAAAEELKAILDRVIELEASGKYTQAIAELSWADQELQKKHIAKLKEFLPDNLAGLTGKDFKANNALGLVTIERTYSDPSGTRLKVSLVGSSSSEGGAGRGLGSLAGFAQMAAAMDKSGNTETVRIKGQRATVSTAAGRTNLTLGLSSGMMFKVEQMGGSANKEKIVGVAEGIDVPGLNTYLAKN